MTLSTDARLQALRQVAESEGLQPLVEAIDAGKANLAQAQLYIADYRKKEQAYRHVGPLRDSVATLLERYELVSKILDYEMVDFGDDEEWLKDKTRDLENKIPSRVSEWIEQERIIDKPLGPTWED